MRRLCRSGIIPLMETIDVTCAIIERGGMVLVARRGPKMHLAGLWEFPGGKIHANETPEACVAREVCEELGIHIGPGRRLSQSVHEYPEKRVRLIPFICEYLEGEMAPVEHDECRWIWPDELMTLEWCPADISVVEEYRAGL